MPEAALRRWFEAVRSARVKLIPEQQQDCSR
jgi:hypothetical protein